MKTKYLLLGIGALVAVGGLWFGRAAWRAHRQLVTWDVRELPLPDVLRKIERQTWTKIRAEKALDEARITLRVTDRALPYVLDRLAEQAGARWSTLYAVYDSTRALQALESALSVDGKLERAGWTRIAPNLPAANPPGSEENSAPPAPSPDPAGGHRQMMFLRQGNAVVLQSADGRVEAWSPEELVMESALKPRLGSEHSRAATAEATAKTARKGNGKWTTYLAFKKSSLGVGFRVPPGHPEPGQAMLGPNPNERFGRLTPEQRVQRARERLGMSRQ